MGGKRRRPYAVRVSIPDPLRPGAVIQRYISYHATVAEAQKALDAYMAGNIPITAVGVTLGEVYDKWSARKYTEISKSAVSVHKGAWKRLSVLQDMEIAKLRVDDFQEVIDKATREGAAPGTVAKVKVLAGQLCRWALERDLIQKDYTVFIKLPAQVPVVEKGTFSEDQIRQLKEMAADGIRGADSVLILIYTGFRIDEFLTLTPADWHPEFGGYLQGGSKTEAGRDRIVPVHSAIADYVQALVERNGPRLFCGTRGNGIRLSNYTNTYFNPVVKELGLEKATPHWCRHTAASRMRMAGMSDIAVKRILGHADSSVTDHYTHTDISYLAKELSKLP